MNAPRKSKSDPTPAYHSAHFLAQDLIERIRDLLQDQPAAEDSTPIHWGHVGTMCEVNQRLASVVAFLDGSEK